MGSRVVSNPDGLMGKAGLKAIFIASALAKNVLYDLDATVSLAHQLYEDINAQGG